MRRLFATIANRYNFITRFLSFGQDQRWKAQLVQFARITPSDRVLDLACGTGDIVFKALHFAPHRVVGLDLTLRMIQLAKRESTLRVRPPAAGPRQVGRRPMAPTDSAPEFIVGDMMTLPFAAGTFEVVTIGYGLRNVPVLDGAVREIHRVLVPGGRLLSLDFDRPLNPFVCAVYLAYLTVVGSTLGLVLHGDPDTYRYIPESIRNYPGSKGVIRLLEAEGFGDVRVVPVLFGLMAIHLARRQ